MKEATLNLVVAMHTCPVVSCPDPTLCEEKGICMVNMDTFLGPGKGINFEHPNQIAVLSTSCDFLPQEFGSTN